MKQITTFISTGLVISLFLFASSCKPANTETTTTPAVETPVDIGPIPSVNYKAIMVKYNISS